MPVMWVSISPPFGPIKVFGHHGVGGESGSKARPLLNAGATTASGFGVISQETQPVFWARLGFIGVDFWTVWNAFFSGKL